MKTINLIFVSFLTFFSQTGFADTTDQLNGCCQTAQETAALQYQNQQLILDQIQMETEEMPGHHAVQQTVNQKVSDKMEERSSLNTIQRETETISMESLQQMTSKVEEHVSRNSSSAAK